MNIFISGGCKNGKSLHAQELARKMAQEKNLPLYYLATMIPVDDEDRARIRRHLSEREGWGFDTIEQGRNICGCLPAEELTRGAAAETAAAGPEKPLWNSVPRTLSGQMIRADGVFLLDSVTALLSNEMFPPGGVMDPGAADRLAGELAEFAARTGNTVFVSDYLYADGCTFDETTECYRRGLALLDRTLARLCDQVIEVTFGMKYYYK